MGGRCEVESERRKMRGSRRKERRKGKLKTLDSRCWVLAVNV